MNTSMRLRMAPFVCLAVLGIALFPAFPLQLSAQEDVLQSSDPDLLALRSQRKALIDMGPLYDPLPQLRSPDAQALQMLDDARRSGTIELRAIIDLLAVYRNLHCEPDRAMLKPLLADRLRLTSRLLEIDAEMPGIIKLPATSKSALKLHDDLLVAKNMLDVITTSLK